jgi:hypothetical protein
MFSKTRFENKEEDEKNTIKICFFAGKQIKKYTFKSLLTVFMYLLL